MFTLNNYTEADINNLKQLVATGAVKYVRFQQEIGESGTPHLQGWCQKSNGSTFPAWKRILGSERYHVEPRRGSVESCETYCTKEDTRQPGTEPWAAGELPAAGHRSDIDGVATLALNLDVAWRDVATSDPGTFCKYHRGLAALRSAVTTHRTKPTRVFWCYGDTGHGKTRWCNTVTDPDRTFWKEGETKWFCGYDPVQHPDVVIDDFRASSLQFTKMLRLFDQYPMSVEGKGSSVPFRAERVFVTTPLPPHETYAGQTDENLQQLARRLCCVLWFYREGARFYIRRVDDGTEPVEELIDLPPAFGLFSDLPTASQEAALERERTRVEAALSRRAEFHERSVRSRVSTFNPGV